MAQQVLTRVNTPSEARKFFEDKMQFTTGPVEVGHILENNENVIIVDVRAAEDYREGHVPGAVNIPIEQWDRPRGLSKDTQNILYCYSGVCHLAAKAAVHFADMGYPVMEMDGGFRAWKEYEMDIEK